MHQFRNKDIGTQPYCVNFTLFKMLMGDPVTSRESCGCYWLNSSWMEYIFLPKGFFPSSGAEDPGNSGSIPRQEEFNHWHHRVPGR